MGYSALCSPWRSVIQPKIIEENTTNKKSIVAMCLPAKVIDQKEKESGKKNGARAVESTKKSRNGRSYYYLSICLPILSGLLHLRIFLVSCLNLTSTRLLSTVAVQNKIITLDTSVVMAYTFDLICCYFFRIIPFSRCNSATDIAGHHLPILLVFIPLHFPMYFERFMHWNPLVLGIFEYYGDGGALREAFIDGGIRANGWGFISSLNEFFMCLQRAEMNSQGLKVFREISNGADSNKERQRIFTSRFAIGLELYFKFGIFCIFSFFGFRACCDVDMAMYQYSAKLNEGLPVWNIFRSLLSSPSFIRTVSYRIFLLFMYPTMGLRTVRKIRHFHRGGFQHDAKGKKD